MFALCIESSHQKGMGHLFRALNLISYLQQQQERFIVLVNRDKSANTILENKNIDYETVDLFDFTSDWETLLIKKYRIDTWINDRLDTDIRHTKLVTKNNVKLVTFDDKGTGAEIADIHVAAMLFNDNDIHKIKGKKVLTGVEYLILNKEIDNYKRIRNRHDRIIVTLGGSDTYGVTLEVVKRLKKQNMSAVIVLGPGFKHKNELIKIIDDRFAIKENVPSLIQEFAGYDLAITGGGITPFEANASGLPCMIIASEIWEIDNGTFLDRLGASVFSGFRDNFNLDLIANDSIIKKMSTIGMQNIPTNAVDKIFKEIVP
jgi:spore coat polysaccharide biosynthesis predicted glycosyltransferase SpsG